MLRHQLCLMKCLEEKDNYRLLCPVECCGESMSYGLPSLRVVVKYKVLLALYVFNGEQVIVEQKSNVFKNFDVFTCPVERLILVHKSIRDCGTNWRFMTNCFCQIICTVNLEVIKELIGSLILMTPVKQNIVIEVHGKSIEQAIFAFAFEHFCKQWPLAYKSSNVLYYLTACSWTLLNPVPKIET